jgi:hypothetical protein
MRSLGIAGRHEFCDIETQLFLRSPHDVPSHHRGFWRAGRKSAASHGKKSGGWDLAGWFDLSMNIAGCEIFSDVFGQRADQGYCFS